MSHPIEQMAVSRSHESVVAHLDEAVGQDVAQESSDKLLCFDGGRFQFSGSGFLVLEGDLALFELADPVVGDGHSEDVGSQIPGCFLARSYGLAVNHPVLLPHCGVHLEEKIGLFELIAELGPEENGEGLLGKEEIVPARNPLAPITREPPAGNEVVDVRVVSHVPSPGLQDAHHADDSPYEPRISSERLQCSSRTAKEDIVEGLLMAARESPQLIGESEGDHEVDDREEQIPLTGQPLLGLMILTFGAVPVLARMVAVVVLVTCLAVVGMAAEGLGPALLDVFHGFEVSWRHPAPVLFPVLLSVGAEDIRHLDSQRSSMIRSMASCAIFSAF